LNDVAAGPDVSETFQFKGALTLCHIVVNVYFPSNPDTRAAGLYTYSYQLICQTLENFVTAFEVDVIPDSIQGTSFDSNEPGLPATVSGVGSWTFFPFSGDVTLPLIMTSTDGPVTGEGRVSGTLESVSAPLLVPGRTATTGCVVNGEPNQLCEGTEGDDIIIGTTASDVIYGLGGNDIIFGGNDNDVIFGSSGDDNLSGNNGGDTLLGGSGNDWLSGGNGDDLDGGPTVPANAGNETDACFGGSGRNTATDCEVPAGSR
jgi:RTX calcium-binding nonapeptide repeat (4 copies)